MPRERDGAAKEAVQSDSYTPLHNIMDGPVKDDLHSMEYPVFSLCKNRDLRIRTFRRGDKYVKIIPSVVGAANVFDKDILIYAASLLVRAAEDRHTPTRRIRFDVHPFLVSTGRSTGGAAYERTIDACRRLRGTTIETNIATTQQERTAGFGLIEDYKVTQYTRSGKGALQLEVMLSDWFYRAVKAYGILTINPNYFSLSQPLERRLYELARKHCGDKAFWKINLQLLQEKTGCQQQIKYFRRDLAKIIERDLLPDYRVVIDETMKPPQVVFLTRDHRKLSLELLRGKQAGWYERLLTQRVNQTRAGWCPGRNAERQRQGSANR